MSHARFLIEAILSSFSKPDPNRVKAEIDPRDETRLQALDVINDLAIEDGLKPEATKFDI